MPGRVISEASGRDRARVETFGNAGFFNVPIYYRGAGEAQYTALCPIVVRPQHWITEEVALTAEEQHRRRAQIRKALGTFSSRVHRGTRDLTAGAILSAGVGVLASVPLVMRILFPRMSARLRRTANSYLQPPPVRDCGSNEPMPRRVRKAPESGFCWMKW